MSIDFLRGKDVYFIAEIGINHISDIQIAKKLIDASFCTNWDCVKFQKRNPDKCVPEKQKNIIKQTPWGEMTYLEYRKKIEFGKREYNQIDKYCRDKPLSWSASIWDLDSLDFMLQYDLPFIKIPSAVIENKELVETAAKSFKNIILSTGMSTIQEIDYGVNNVLKYNNNLVVMHCNSSYPAEYKELNLRCIPMLRERYNTEVGYSGHEKDLEPTVIAVSLGAKVVERHITLDHNMWGSDQKASLEVHAMDMLRKRCKDVNMMLGDGVKVITKSEMPIREKLRKNLRR